MKKLVLSDHHEELGGKMVDYAGFYMPVQYEGVKQEHEHVRNKVGIFDVSHMGEFLISGASAIDLIQYISSNDASKLSIGDVQYSWFPNEQGGIVDDLLVYRLGELSYMLVVNAGNIQKDWEWVVKHNEQFNADIKNVSEDYSLFAVQGPDAKKMIQSIAGEAVAELKYYTFSTTDFLGASDIIVSATGYTGAGGFEIYVPNEKAVQVWEGLFEVGKDHELKPIGLAARDTLRLEMGYCLYGNEINDTTSPIEAGLSWITKFNKDFVNKADLLKQKTEGVSKKLVGIELIERGIPRNGYPVSVDDEPIGTVTSGTMSPSLGKAIGMAYVKKEFSEIGTKVDLEIRSKKISAKVVAVPFK